MWNPFSRTTRGGAHAAGAHGRTAPAADEATKLQYDIADVDRIGPITVVTLTVEELSQQFGGVAALADVLDDLVSRGHRHLILDIQNVAFMDSACVGCMVSALNQLARAGGSIALANPGSSVTHLFRITRLDRVFPVCNDVLAAMNVLERHMQQD